MVYRNGEVLYFVSLCTSLFHCRETLRMKIMSAGLDLFVQPDSLFFFFSGQHIIVATCCIMTGSTIHCSREKYRGRLCDFRYFEKPNTCTLGGRRSLKLFCDSFGFLSLHKPLIVLEGLLCTSACQLLTKWGYSVSPSTVNFNNLLEGPPHC